MIFPIKRPVVLLGLTLGFLGLSVAVGYRAQSQTKPTHKAKKAFVAHLRVLQFGNTQKPPHIQNEVFALRSDGSYVRRFETVSPKGEVGWAVDIVDVRSGRYTLLEPFTRTAVTFYRTDDEMQSELRTRVTCSTSSETEKALARADKVVDKILDREVVQVVERHEGSRRQVTTERWVAPDLDCFPLRKSEWSQTGSHNETEVTKLEVGEPPDSMFEIPAGFIESSPIQAEAAYAALYPGFSLWGTKAVTTIEERYGKSQSKKRR